jgi:hypothetical protein
VVGVIAAEVVAAAIRDAVRSASPLRAVPTGRDRAACNATASERG